MKKTFHRIRKRSKKRFISIKLKLIFAYTSIVLLSTLAFGLVVFLHSESVVIRLARHNVEQTMLASHQALIAEIDNINACMLSFQIKKEVQEILTEPNPDNILDDISILEQTLLEADTFQNNLSKMELYVLDRDDYPPLSEGGTVFSSRQLKNDLWFQDALKNRSSTKWLIRNNINQSQGTVVAAKVLTDVTNNDSVAVLKTSINIHSFTDRIQDITLAETGRVFLSSSNHLVGYEDSALGQNLVNNPVLFGDMLKSTGNETRTVVLNGADWLISSYPLKDTGLFLVGAVKIDEFRSTQSTITTAILVTGAVLVLLSLIFIWIISLVITRPVTTLTAAMRTYTPGVSVPLKHQTRDELGILFAVFNNMQDTIADLITNVNRETEIRKCAEMKALQAQITPHFLYNTLNSICVLSKKYGASDIQQMIMALSKFFKISLNNGAEMVTLEQELEHVESYMYIQKIRYSDRFDIDISIAPELKEYIICKLTLQPLVENCINHAFTDLEEPGHITLCVQKEGEDIVLTVSDNGPMGLVDIEELNRYVSQTFDPDDPIEKYGIHNINQRIHLYFGNAYGLSYYPNHPNGLTAMVRIRAVKRETIRQNKNDAERTPLRSSEKTQRKDDI